MEGEAKEPGHKIKTSLLEYHKIENYYKKMMTYTRHSFK